MQSKLVVAGITGGIGSGKTTTCKIFDSLGVRIYSADERAKWLMEHDPELAEQIRHIFDGKAFKEGKPDRKYIANAVFNNDLLLKKLNAAVHPVVSRDMKNWVDENQEGILLLKEAALLFETSSYLQLDKTILITAPEDIRIKRVTARDSHRNESDVKKIIAKQMSDEEKILLADFTIENDGRKSLIKQVMDIYPTLIVA